MQTLLNRISQKICGIITLEECEKKHWLEGPFSWQQLEERHSGSWLPCCCFAVWQSNKWRPIDDFSEKGVNATYSICEKIHLRALDETTWVAMTLMRFMRDRGQFCFQLKDGQVLSGEVRKSWYVDHQAPRPLVKTMDLKSAYKQWAIAPSDVSKAILVLKNPHNSEVVGFECLTLPFGLVSSVNASTELHVCTRGSLMNLR